MQLKDIKVGRMFLYMDRFFFKTDSRSHGLVNCMAYPSGQIVELDDWEDVDEVKCSLTIKGIKE